MTPIPLELVVGGRELTEPRLSPDGRSVAFVQRWGPSAGVMVVDVAGGPERILTTSPEPVPGRGMGGGCFDWLADSSGIVYVGSGESRGTSELWLQPLLGDPRQLTEFGRSCTAPSSAGGLAVVAVDEAEIWLLSTGQGRAPSRIDDGRDAFCFDPVIAPSSDRVAWQAWSPPDMPWDGAGLRLVDVVDGQAGPVEHLAITDAALQQPRFGAGADLFCVHDASGWLNVSVGEHPVVIESFEHAGPTWGMGQRSFAPSPDGRQVAFTRNESGYGRLCVVDRTSGHVTEIGRGVHGQIGWVADSIVALRSGARTPTQIVRYDATANTRTVLAVGPPVGWDHVELPEPDSMQVDGDGVALHARRYGADQGRLLTWIHGGPTDQWPVDFRPRIAYWWSRGWDVLVVDPRGSTGHGRGYQRALNGGWGRIDVDDTAALIEHAHSLAWARPATTAVIGGSAGGLTVLGVLADHGRLVAAGVASYPVSDIAALAASTHRFEAHYNDTLVGPRNDVALFDTLSPIGRAGRITAPLLLFHGSDDPVVPMAHSDALAAAIRTAGGHVDYVVYEGEGHGFREPRNIADEYRRIEAFLADHVGPSPHPRER